MTKLIQNLRDGVPGAENSLLEYVETHYLSDSEQLQLIDLLESDNLRNVATKILSNCARKNMLCPKAHEELAAGVKDPNYRENAKEILLACLEGWGIWTEGLVVLVNLLKDTDCHTSADAKSILLKQIIKWRICGKALYELILQKNAGVEAASELLEVLDPFRV